MKPLELNLSRFRKIADDGETSTFRHHDNGHEIKIAHKGLTREMRSYLKALPIYDDESDEEKPKVSKNKEAGVVEVLKSKSAPKKDEAKEKLHGVMRRRYAEGDLVEPAPAPNDAPQENKQAPVQIFVGGAQTPQASQMPPVAPPPQQEFEQYPNATPMPAKEPGREIASDEGSNQEEETAPDQQAPKQEALQAPEQTLQPGQAPANQELAQPQAPVQAGGPSAPDQGMAPTILHGFNTELAGLTQDAAARAELGKQEAKIYENQNIQVAKAKQEVDNARSKILTNINQLQDELRGANGEVNPDHYWANHSKLATVLSLVIGGLDPRSGPNQAQEYLNQAIQRDVQAQLKKIDTKQSLLGRFYEQLNNLPAAYNMTLGFMQLQAANQLKAAAAKAEDPLQRARLLMGGGHLEREAGNQMAPVAFTQAIYEMMKKNEDPTELLKLLDVKDQKMAEQIKKYHLPGYGRTTKEVTPQVTQSVAAKDDLLNQVDKYKAFIKAHSVNGIFNPDLLSPIDRKQVNEQAETFHHELEQKYGIAVNAGKNESEMDSIKSIVGKNPTSFFSALTNLPKLEALGDTIRDSRDAYIHGLGTTPYTNSGWVDPYARHPAQASATKGNRQVQSNAPQLTEVGGKKYQMVYSPKKGKMVGVPVQ